METDQAGLEVLRTRRVGVYHINIVLPYQIRGERGLPELVLHLR
jgi:hypothetical protein